MLALRARSARGPPARARRGPAPPRGAARHSAPVRRRTSSSRPGRPGRSTSSVARPGCAAEGDARRPPPSGFRVAGHEHRHAASGPSRASGAAPSGTVATPPGTIRCRGRSTPRACDAAIARRRPRAARIVWRITAVGATNGYARPRSVAAGSGSVNPVPLCGARRLTSAIPAPTSPLREGRPATADRRARGGRTRRRTAASRTRTPRAGSRGSGSQPEHMR